MKLDGFIDPDTIRDSQKYDKRNSKKLIIVPSRVEVLRLAISP